MFKGDLANTTNPTLWVHSDVLIKTGKRFLFIGPKKRKIIRKDWLWSVSYFARPIIIYIDTPIHQDLFEYDSLYFSNFNACKDALRVDQQAIELVVDDPFLLSKDIVLYQPNTGKYL